ncbi:MAG: MurR/RpiR family transcriptional regulator [Haloechinothrix sp.]
MTTTDSSRPPEDFSARGADQTPDQLADRVRQHWNDLAPAEKNLAEFLVGCAPETLVFATAQSLGQLAGTSDATVVRTAKRLGYSGLADLKRDVGLAFARSVAPGERLRQRITEAGGNHDTLFERVCREAVERIEQTRAAFDGASFERAVGILAAAREVMAYGVGASELGARHLVLKLNRIGHPARFVGSTGFPLADELLSLDERDAVVVFAPLRLLHDGEVLLIHAASLGARTVLVADRPLGDRHADRVDAVLTAPHTPTGITNEALPAETLADALILAVAATDEQRAVHASELLTRLRARLGATRPRERS